MTQHVAKSHDGDETELLHSDGPVANTPFAGKLGHLELVKPDESTVASETRSDVQELAEGQEEAPRPLTREEAVRRIATISNPKSLRKFARACGDAGIIAVDFNKDGSFQAKVLESGENQDIADLFIAKQTEVAEARKSEIAEKPAPAPKAEKKQSKQAKQRPQHREQEEPITDEQVVQAAIAKIPSLKDKRDMEILAYDFHKLGTIKKVFLANQDWKVEAIEGKELSKELVEAIMNQRKAITLARKQEAEKEKERERQQALRAEILRRVRR